LIGGDRDEIRDFLDYLNLRLRLRGPGLPDADTQGGVCANLGVLDP
jgi:hypothetical protein